MNANTTDNVVELFGSPDAPDGRANDEIDKLPYRAFDFDDTEFNKGNEEWFRIHGDPNDLPNSVELCRYVDILKVYSPLHQLLTIICEDVSFQMEGQHLSDIASLIQDRKLRALYLFEPAIHMEPSADEVMIHTMERYSMAEELE